MTRQNATNFTGGLQFPYATAATDLFKKEDVQVLAQAVDAHDHTTGKGALITTTPAAGSITNAQLGSDVARANLLTNGGFEIWQRGNGPFATTGIASADRWFIQSVGTDTLSISRNTAQVDNASAACAAVTFTLGTGAGGSSVYQAVTELLGGAFGGIGGLSGCQLSLSLRVRTSTASAVRIAIADQAGTNLAVSGFHSGGGAYETLTCTTPVLTSGTTALYIKVYHAASCTSYLDNACLVIGSQPANWVPLHPADDLYRCQRYFEVIGGTTGGAPSILGYAGVAGTNWGMTAFFKATKPVTPTLTKSGTWSVTNAAQPTIDSPSLSSCRIFSAATAIGAFAVTADVGILTAESNP